MLSVFFYKLSISQDDGVLCEELKGGRTRGIRSGNICPFYCMSLNGIGGAALRFIAPTLILTNKSKYVKSFALHYTVV